MKIPQSMPLYLIYLAVSRNCGSTMSKRKSISAFRRGWRWTVEGEAVINLSPYRNMNEIFAGHISKWIILLHFSWHHTSGGVGDIKRVLTMNNYGRIPAVLALLWQVIDFSTVNNFQYPLACQLIIFFICAL